MKKSKKAVILSVAFSALHFTVLSLIIFTLFFSPVSLAAYTNSRHAQRTIANYAANGDKFSSNLLAKVQSKQNVRVVYTTGVVDPKERVTICNYEQGRQALPYENNITYSLAVSLVKYDAETEEKYVAASSVEVGAYKASVQLGNDTPVVLDNGNLSHTFSGALTGNTPDEDVFIVTMDKEFATVPLNLYLELVATPSDATLPTIRGIIKAELKAEGVVNAWSGRFIDSTEDAPADYDGYQYRVEGTGSGTFTLQWDSTKLSLSDRSLIFLGQTATQVGDTDYYEISFAVDSSDTMEYTLQFHKENITNETWPEMNGTLVPDAGTVVKYRLS